MHRIILALLFVPAVLPAQEKPDEPRERAAAEDPNLQLSAALRQLQGAADLVAKVEVKQEEKELPVPGGAGGAIVNIQHNGGAAAAKPFEGTVEAWRDRDGDLVVLSQQALPGFGVYVARGRVVKEVTFEDETWSLGQIEAELAPLMDPHRLARHLLDARLAPRKDPATGLWVFRGPVSRKLVKRMEGVGMVAKRVLRAEAEVAVTAAGELRRVAVKVVHNDPVRELMRKSLRGVGIQIGGGGAPPQDDGDDDDEHDVETGSTTYTLRYEGAPSQRAQVFKERMKKLAR